MSKNPIQPDVSPKPRKKFDERQVIMATCLVAVFIGLLFVLSGALNVNDRRNLDEAIARAEEREAIAKQKELDFLSAAKAVKEREEEVATRERKLESRAANITTRETELETNIESFENEKAEFYASQSRVYALTSALTEELAPGMNSLPLEEAETDAEESTESVVYIDPDDPDLIIEEVTVE